HPRPRPHALTFTLAPTLLARTLTLPACTHALTLTPSRQACKCLSSPGGQVAFVRRLSRSHARARARSGVLARATRPCAWLRPCAGPAPRRRPSLGAI